MSRLMRLIPTAIILVLIAAVCLLSVPAPASAQAATPPVCLRVDQALAQKLVDLALSGNGNLFFRDPLDYRIKNLSGKRLDICIPAGMTFVPDGTGVQDLMVSATAVVSLQPGEEKSGALFTYCINESKSAPSAGENYRPGPMASGALLRMAQAGEKRNASGRLGAQMAAWAISDGFTLDDLGQAQNGADSAGLTQVISPLLCLAGSEIQLAQELLDAAGADTRLYQGNTPATPAYCSSQGIPNLSDLGQQAKALGIKVVLYAVAGLLGCVVVAGGLVFLAVRLARAGKKS